MTNGTWRNYAAHFAIALVLAALLMLAGSPPVAAAIASALVGYAKEVGEQSVKHDWRNRSVWTDINPAHRNWSTDDRLDLTSWAAGAIAAAVVL